MQGTAVNRIADDYEGVERQRARDEEEEEEEEGVILREGQDVGWREKHTFNSK